MNQTLVKGLGHQIHVIGHTRQGISLFMAIKILERYTIDLFSDGISQAFCEALNHC